MASPSSPCWPSGCSATQGEWAQLLLLVDAACEPTCPPSRARAIAACLHSRSRPAPAFAACRNTLRGTQEGRKLFTGLYITVVFLFIRNIFRFAEFAQTAALGYPRPEDAYIISEKQYLFYIFDTIPILLIFVGACQGCQPAAPKRGEGGGKGSAGLLPACLLACLLASWLAGWLAGWLRAHTPRSLAAPPLTPPPAAFIVYHPGRYLPAPKTRAQLAAEDKDATAPAVTAAAAAGAASCADKQTGDLEAGTAIQVHPYRGADRANPACC